MNNLMQEQVKTFVNPLVYMPVVSIIHPFNPKMVTKVAIISELRQAFKEVESELTHRFNKQMSTVVLDKLNTIITRLNYGTHKRSIAIYVSPIMEKVFYMNMDVEKRVIVNPTYDIRALIRSRKINREYLVLQLTKTAGHIYIGKQNSLRRMVSMSPQPETGTDSIRASTQPAKITSSSKEYKRRKFMDQVNNSLGLVLSAYPLPLFLIGNTRVISDFRSQTTHNKSITQYIPNKIQNNRISDLIDLLSPYTSNWNKLMETYILQQLTYAQGKNNLRTGVTDVWEEVKNHRGKMLLVEKDYTAPIGRIYKANPAIDFKATMQHVTSTYETVDRIIEMVIEDGGEVRLVENNTLINLNRIALITNH